MITKGYFCAKVCHRIARKPLPDHGSAPWDTPQEYSKTNPESAHQAQAHHRSHSPRSGHGCPSLRPLVGGIDGVIESAYESVNGLFPFNNQRLRHINGPSPRFFLSVYSALPGTSE